MSFFVEHKIIYF